LLEFAHHKLLSLSKSPILFGFSQIVKISQTGTFDSEPEAKAEVLMLFELQANFTIGENLKQAKKLLPNSIFRTKSTTFSQLFWTVLQ
jgi:hypothetical protein